MSHPASVLSKTLQSITVTKIRELEKQRAQYEDRKSKILQEADRHLSQPERIGCLLRGVKELYSNENDGDSGVDNIKSLLAQSKYDASVPPHMLQSSEDLLSSKLDVQSHKLSMAHLYSSLVTEWMNPGEPMEGTSSAAASAEQESSFEVVDRQKERLQSLCDQFEKIVFTPLETDEAEIDKYLDGFFNTDGKKELLDDVRSRTRAASEALLQKQRPFNENSIKQCIKGLLEQDLLSDEKQTILKEFEQNELVLREIADVLNTRFADFESWSWDAGEEGVPVLPRQQLNGKYRIWMDEDVLQAIFIHYVGISSCVSLKPILRDVVSDDKHNFWRWHAGPAMTEREAQRRVYYLDEWLSDAPARRLGREKNRPRARGASLDAPFRVNLVPNIARRRARDYVDNFCVAALPGRVGSLNNGLYADEGEQSEDSDDDEGGWGEEDAGTPASKLNIKQFLLRTLATEIMIQQSFHGEAAVVQSDLKWFGASLSHTSIVAVMRFFGFPENLIAFYKKVLEAPLNLSPSSDSLSASKPRTRRRGMPMARAPEKLIGELVLFVMDLAVNQETGLQLYRLHDDLWVAGAPADTARAWAAMQRFARVMGLEFNAKKTGSVYLADDGLRRDEAIAAELPGGAVRVGHLVLDPRSGRWVIDRENVAEHVAQLKKQLAESRSVLDWVRTWNSCIGRFFGHAFGEPAFCFGKEHVESVLETYRAMQRDIFAPWCRDAGGGCSAVRYMKSKIEKRFGVSDVSDAFLLFPDQLGGLGLRNPFVPFLMARERLDAERCGPAEAMTDFLEAERAGYELKKKAFEALGGHEAREARAERHPHRFDPADVLGPGEADRFMSFEEYVAHREVTSACAADAYGRLQGTPDVAQLRTDREVDAALDGLDVGPASVRAETKWVVQMYHEEAKKRCGGLGLVEERFLPLGVIAMMRKKAVRWGLVL